MGSKGLAVFLCMIAASSTSAFAHHGYAAYDMQARRTLKGTITDFQMANPHTQIQLDVKDDAGNVQHWVIEDAGTVRAMKMAGWDFDSLKPGDEVTITYNPAKGPGHAGLLIKCVLPDGSALPKPRANSSAPTE